MACSNGGFHGNTRTYTGCGMVLFNPNVVEGPCVGLVNGAKQVMPNLFTMLTQEHFKSH